MVRHISLISIVLLLGLASTAYGTTCSASVNSCLAYTDDVTQTCSTPSCTCTDASSYSATDYGCADTDAIAQAQISAGVYSGEVATGQTISLRCLADGFTETTTTVYAWYVDGNADAETSNTLTHTGPADGTTESITCSISDSGLTSATSDAFVVTGVDTSAGTISEKPILTGNPDTIITGGTVDLACTNIPVHTNVQYDITDATSSTSAGADTPKSGATEGETYTCTLSDSGSVGLTLSSPASDSVAVPTAVAADDTNSAVEITITGYSSPLTINEATDMAPQCVFTNAATTNYPAAAYQWKDGGANLPGGVTSATTATLDTTELTAGTTYVLTCEATVATHAVTSSSFTLTLSDSVIEAVSVELRPSAQLMAGNYLAMRCIVAAESISDITYSWYFDNELLTGHDDHTLQIYESSSGTHDGDYKCRATNGGFYMESAPETVGITAVATVKPTISSSKVTTRYGIGNSYTLTCAVSNDPEALALTYKWYSGGTLVNGESGSTYTITASSTSVDYTCKATFDSTDTDESDPETVQGYNIMSVELSGPESPVVGASEVYTCTASLVSSAGTATYSIKNGVTEVDTTSSYSIASVAAVSGSDDGSYTCEVTANSETQTSNTINLASVATPVTPTVTVPSPLNTGGSYSLTCASASIGPDTTVTYAWTKGGTAITGETSSTYTFTAEATSAATYGCTITINSQASVEGTGTVTVGDSMGLPCTDSNFDTVCGADFALYTGNCVSEYCQCQTNVALTQDACGGSGVGAVAASVLVIFVGLFSVFSL